MNYALAFMLGFMGGVGATAFVVWALATYLDSWD